MTGGIWMDSSELYFLAFVHYLETFAKPLMQKMFFTLNIVLQVLSV